MLLIFFLGLIAKLASYCYGCDVGTTDVNNFDWNQFKGVWYFISHYDIAIENEFDCVKGAIEIPLLGFRVTYFTADINGTVIPFLNPGTKPVWNSAGYFYLETLVEIWTGKYYVITIDYDSYVIIKLCHTFDFPDSVYVWCRSPHPDAATMQDVRNKLQEYNVNNTQLVDWPNANC